MLPARQPERAPASRELPVPRLLVVADPRIDHPRARTAYRRFRGRSAQQTPRADHALAATSDGAARATAVDARSVREARCEPLTGWVRDCAAAKPTLRGDEGLSARCRG